MMKFKNGVAQVFGARVLVLALLLLAQGAAAQTVFQINSLGDGPVSPANGTQCATDEPFGLISQCTLRAAIQAANNLGTPVEIRFTNIPVPAGGDGLDDGVSSVIRPQTALPAINSRITIAGETHPNFDPDNGFQRVQIDGGNVVVITPGLAINSGGAQSVIRHLSIRNFRSHGINLLADNVTIQANRLGTYNLGAIDASGPTAGNDGYGLRIGNSSGSEILDNFITDNDAGGIALASNARNTLLAGNQIGVQLAAGGGLLATGNGGPGINFLSTAGLNNEVGRCVIIPGVSNFCRGNLIVANEGHGINIAASGQSVVFNTIGLNGEDPDNASFGNTGAGIRIAASNVFVGGGVAPANTANIIGHNGGEGVLVASGNDNTISQNRIGGLDDETLFGNGGAGVRIAAGGDHTISGNLIRANTVGISSASGPTLITDNEVIGNGNLGIEVTDWRHTIEDNVVGLHELIGIALAYPYNASQAASVYGNWIGTAPDGTPLGNSNGIVVNAGRALIGQNQGRGNIVAGNANAGIVLTGARNVLVRGNFIGQLPDGTPSGNRGAGILIQPRAGGIDAFDSQIGYLATASIPSEHFPVAAGGFGQGNLIAHNEIGVRIDGGSGAIQHRLRGNSIFKNELGGVQIFPTIGLINEGAGEGPNRGLNHPQFDDNATFFNASASEVNYRIRIPTAASQAAYPLRIDFYLTDVDDAPPQGRFYIGSADYVAASAMLWQSGSFTPVGSHDLQNARIVAQATDAAGNSSEFSFLAANLSVIGDPEPAVITVSSLGDQAQADPGSLVCDTGEPRPEPGVRHCTLRAAIQTANNFPDGPVEIRFWESLPFEEQTGNSTIVPTSLLPPIRNEVIVAGETHSQFDPDNGLPRVVIFGRNVSSTGNDPGLSVENTSGAIIRHLAVIGFPGVGIRVLESEEVLIEHNRIGLVAQGGTDEVVPNGTVGIFVTASDGTWLNHNWVSGNGGDGIRIGFGSENTGVGNNRIGLRRVPFAPFVEAVGNAGNGILVTADAGSAGQTIGTCVNPALVPCTGNIVVGNGAHGIRLDTGNNALVDNWIGIAPDAPEDDSFGNREAGIHIASSDNQVSAWTNAFGGNRIGHSGAQGIFVADDADNNLIFGARIGTDHDGSVAGNSGSGIAIGAARGNLIRFSRIVNNASGVGLNGGPNVIEDNWIVGNGAVGIAVLNNGQDIERNVIGGHSTAGIVLQHPFIAALAGVVNLFDNHIGVSPAGDALANGIGVFANGAGFANIGNPDRGNVIGFNLSDGVRLDRTSGNFVQGNWIGQMPNGHVAGNAGAGIRVSAGSASGNSNGNTIGFQAGSVIPAGYDPAQGGPGNIIAHNAEGAVVDVGFTGTELLRNTIRGNRFTGNTSAGIRLGAQAGTIDPGGSQVGPNTLLNFPELDPGATFFNAESGEVEFRVRVQTTAANAAYPLTLDFYLSDPGTPQGRIFLASADYSAASAEQWLSGSLLPPVGLNVTGEWLVATATDAEGNTSEFTAQPVRLDEEQGEPADDEIILSSLGDHSNADPGSTLCNTGLPEPAPGVAHCTLRAAIQAANNRSERTLITVWENIEVNADGASIIVPATPLPVLASEIQLDGNTHPEYSDSRRPKLAVDGSAQGSKAVLRLRAESSGSWIRGLAVFGGPENGIRVEDADQVRFSAMVVGARPAGEGNEPAGNAFHGIVLSGASTPRLDLVTAVDNGLTGIQLTDGTTDARVAAVTVGGLVLGAVNVIEPVGNRSHGIHVTSTAGPENRIGSESVANTIVANGGAGLRIDADDQRIGAHRIGSRFGNEANDQYGNAGPGIWIGSSNNEVLNLSEGRFIRVGYGDDHGVVIEGGNGNLLRGLLVGVSDTGINQGNAGYGLVIAGGAGNVVSDSVIGFNGEGGVLMSDALLNAVERSWIGRHPDGMPIGNQGPGVEITVLNVGETAQGNQIGFATGDAIPLDHVGEGVNALGNVIGHNSVGVRVNSEIDGAFLQRNVIRGNRFIANAAGGIDLGPDAGDSDPGGAGSGPNRLQNAPRFNADASGLNEGSGQIQLRYRVDTTTANASYPLRVDFYLADAGGSQGEVFLATQEYAAASAGQEVSFTINPPAGLEVDGRRLVATATDNEGNTSQFSQAVPLGEQTEPDDRIFFDRFKQQ